MPEENSHPSKRARLSSSSSPGPHSCRHCQQIFIVPPPPRIGRLGFRVRLPHTKSDAFQASRDGCPMFNLLLDGYKIGTSTQGLKDLVRGLDQKPNWQFPRAGARGPEESVIYFAECLSKRPFMIRFDEKGDILFTCMGWSSPWFKVTSLPSDPAFEYFPVRPIDRDVGSKAAFGQAKTWMNECLGFEGNTTHSSCSAPRKYTTVPTRLLKIDSTHGNTSVQLYMTKEDEQLNYACLSYCWGGDQPVKTTLALLKGHFMLIEFLKLPRTIQDAILVAHKLGINFLWIDCLCIVQDDPNDMTRELQKMPLIYQNAVVTICASSANTCYDGFLGKRSVAPGTSCEDLVLRYQCINGMVGNLILSEYAPYSSVEDPINSRAWTLQERLLSPRLLDYGVRQLRWHCLSRHEFDGGLPPETLEREGNTMRFNMSAISRTSTDREELDVETFIFDNWALIVDDYSKRSLSFPDDKLVALSALASESGETLKLTYLAGLWLEYLPSQLLWRLWDKPEERPAKYRAPSWSWASVESWIMLQREVENIEIEILKHEIILANPALPYGAVKSGHLVVRGRLRKGVWFFNRESKIILEGYSEPHVTISLDSSSDSDLDSEELNVYGELIHESSRLPEQLDRQTLDAVELIPDALEDGWNKDNLNASADVSCLQIKSEDWGTAGLLLVPICGIDDGFKRVGYFHFESRERDCFAELGKKNITLY